MTVQLALLKSGEEVIADMKEMVIPDGDDHRVIGYIFTRPCTVKLENKNNLSDLKGNRSYEIGLFPWMPFSHLKKFVLLQMGLHWLTQQKN